MAARSLGRIAKLKPSAHHRCTLPAFGRMDAGGDFRRESRDEKDARTLLSQTRNIHVTRRSDSTVLLASAAIAASAVAARYGLQEYKKYQAAQPAAKAKDGPADAATASGEPADGKAKKASPESPGTGAAASAGGLFGAFGKRFYEGGFDEKMTRKEAALILGVRERAPAQRIKDSHRRILMINHPDKGGSKYMAAKINEAKEVLLKGRK